MYEQRLVINICWLFHGCGLLVAWKHVSIVSYIFRAMSPGSPSTCYAIQRSSAMDTSWHLLSAALEGRKWSAVGPEWPWFTYGHIVIRCYNLYLYRYICYTYLLIYIHHLLYRLFNSDIWTDFAIETCMDLVFGWLAGLPLHHIQIWVTWTSWHFGDRCSQSQSQTLDPCTFFVWSAFSPGACY